MTDKTEPVEGEIVKNELAVILDEQKISPENQKSLIKAFGGPFNEVGAILADFSKDEETGDLVVGENAIKITDVTQVKEMSEARENRLLLRKARITIENKRKELGEEALRTSQAINKVAKFFKEQIEPVEDYLGEQEKFKELREATEKAERLAARTAAISKLSDPDLYKLEDMSEEAFQELLIKLEKEEAERVATERKIEEEKLAAEKAERERQAKILEENKRLELEKEEQRQANERKLARVNQVTALGLAWSESLQSYKLDDLAVSKDEILDLNDVKWKVHLTDIEKTIAERREAVEAVKRAEEAEREAELARQREEAEQERKRREDLEKAEAERKAAAEKAATESKEAERQALLAPDKDKIKAIVPKLVAIREDLPATRQQNAQGLVEAIDAMLGKAIAFIDEKVEEL